MKALPPRRFDRSPAVHSLNVHSLTDRPRSSGGLVHALFWLVLLGPSLVALAGCGHGHRDPLPPLGEAVVDNRTDLTTNEILFDFFIAAPGSPFSADLLGGDLPPSEARSVGFFPSNVYDAEGDLELGQVISWFDVFVGEGDTTVFEVN